MPFESVLFKPAAVPPSASSESAPDYFHDLNLDQVIDTLTRGYEEYDLKIFFSSPLKTVEAIEYRHEVMRDLRHPRILESIEAFTDGMRQMRNQLRQSKKMSHPYQQQRWLLHSIETYCTSIRGFADDFAELAPKSRALQALREHAADYCGSDLFERLAQESKALAMDLGQIRYTVHIKDNAVTVRDYSDEGDYSVDVGETFERFAQGATREYLFQFAEYPQMNHIEEKILEFVAALHPEPFARLTAFVEAHQHFQDAIIRRFDREIHFYLAYRALMNTVKDSTRTFCYPHVTEQSGIVSSQASFDLALAIAARQAETPIVCNNFELTAPERILVVSGPNQGGKTTFARTFGQLHYLAALGCPVPGTSARLVLPDMIFSHFERGENPDDRRGKLQDDLIRIKAILNLATDRSVLVLNEIFSTTTLRDALALARYVLDEISACNALCVCVTFLDELATLNAKTVSMVSTVAPDDPARRTYKILRRPANGRSYAISIAEKYNLTYDRLIARIPS